MRQTNALKYLRHIIVASAVIVYTTHAVGEDRLFFGKDYAHKIDSSGKTAVLCALGQYLYIQSLTASCKFSRRPADDAIDHAINEIDEFIIANSPAHVTSKALTDLQSDWSSSLVSKAAAACSKKDADIFVNSGLVTKFRNVSPAQISASVKELLSVPRDPVWNPCRDVAP